MPIISLSINDSLLEKFDKILSERGYTSRSEAFREAIRDYVVEYEWTEETGDGVIAVIALLHERKAQKDPISVLQHEYDDIVQTLMHMHLDEVNCLEIFVTKGNGKRIKELVQKVKQIRGVRQVKFVTTVCEI